MPPPASAWRGVCRCGAGDAPPVNSVFRNELATAMAITGSNCFSTDAPMPVWPEICCATPRLTSLSPKIWLRMSLP